MGTRRPLIVQMVHDPTATQPRCSLQNEEGSDYGQVLPESTIAEAIQERTEDHLRRLGAPVSSKPIVMRAEYAFSPNLTIIDTPGFILKARQGEAESTPNDILAMVKEQCAPRHRLILFLQQSSVEWCSSLWMHVLQEVDPGFSRTVMVASKFDNRMKEFSERWELEKYLSAAGYLPPSVKPFFVALPKEKTHTASADWRSAIQVVDADIKRHLRTAIDGGLDEERFGNRIGFGNLKKYLEDELAKRYRDAAPATLALLQDRCTAVSAELRAVEQRLQRAGDVGALRRAAIQHTLSLAGRVDAVMSGFGGADPKRYGLTTEEERSLPGATWPSSQRYPAPPNATLRLFGGAAFERCLQEFGRVVESIAFPSVPRDQIANMLLAQRSRGDGAGAAARAAEEVARGAARQTLGPLFDAVCVRLGCVIRKAYEIAAEMEVIYTNNNNNNNQNTENIDSADILKPYVAFHSALRTAFNRVSVSLECKGKELLHAHLTTATGHFSAAAVLESVAEGGGGGGHGIREEHHWGEEFADIRAIDDERQYETDGEVENEAPLLAERPPFATTAQLTVPETPSPDLTTTAKAEIPLARRAHLAAITGRNVDAASPGKGRVAKVARLTAVGGGAGPSRLQQTRNAAAAAVLPPLNSLCAKPQQGIQHGSGGGYVDVCAAAEQLFCAVKESIVAQGPALKATFLEPLQADLAMQLCMGMVGKTDTEFMGHFATAGALAALEAERDAVKGRGEGLMRMTEEFNELSRAL